MEKQKKVIVPVLDGRILENGVGTNETEAAVNLDFVLEDDAEFNRVEYYEAWLTIPEDQTSGK